MAVLRIRTNSSHGSVVTPSDLGWPIPASGGFVDLDDAEEVQTLQNSEASRTFLTDNVYSPEATLILVDVSGTPTDVLQVDALAFLDNFQGKSTHRIKNNIASVAPTVNDDETKGYEEHSQWLDSVTFEIWSCWDATATAAVWKKSPTGGSASSGRASFVVTLTSQTGAVRETASTSYETLGKFVYDGINILGSATAILANAWKISGPGGATFDVRIFDLSNGNAIAGILAQSATDPHNIIDLGSISNLPSTRAVFAVQCRRSGGANAKAGVSSVVLEF